MEQKFKVGDLVKCIAKGDKLSGALGKVVYVNITTYAVDFGDKYPEYIPEDLLELAYPSDHDLLDFAARDSMVAELKAENEALKAELEKYKPKPRRKTFKVVLIGYEDGRVDWFPESEIGRHEADIIARKTVTITEGEGM